MEESGHRHYCRMVLKTLVPHIRCTPKCTLFRSGFCPQICSFQTLLSIAVTGRSEGVPPSEFADSHRSHIAGARVHEL